MDSILTKGSPIKGIILFSIPLLLGNIFQQIYTISDTLIVGRVVGVQALAAVGATGGLTFLIIGFAQGMTTGLSIITAQHFGAGDVRKVKESFATSIIICLITTVILTILSVALTRPLLVLMQTPSSLLSGAETFLTIIFAGLGATMFFNLFSNMLRSLGNSRAPLVFLAIACVINVVLDLLLIIQFHMGIAGAGVATVSAQLFSCLLCWWYIKRSVRYLSLSWSDMHTSMAEIQEQIKIGLPMGFQASIIAIGSIILQVSLNELGPQSIAAYTAAGKVDQIAVQPMMSMGITMATFTAQNYGAKYYNRILKGIRQCLTTSISYSVIVGVLIVLNSRFLVNLFIGNSEQHITNLAHQYFIIVSSSYFLLAMLFVIRYTLQGFGKSMAPTMAGIAELISRVVVGIAIVPMFGFLGACFANPLAWIGSNLVLVWSYLQTVRAIKKDATE
ncbi:MATE family efflux transporter [Pediococcus argentinicus]|uniref:MATE family efflux transporter n=1 Tax=Pediococcus argentinicus TaxID=480391 RepID=UPI0033902CAD